MASSRAHRSTSSSYDVFINFRGSDTRPNFASLVYYALRKDGIEAYIDSEKLWVGYEICSSLLEAIKRSDISIPVISQNYADSKDCLLELAEIWKCHESNKGQFILPVFIDVEPRDVRPLTGSFNIESMLSQKKYNPADLESWKNALKGGRIKGIHSQGERNHRVSLTLLAKQVVFMEQLNLVQSIVQMVSRELLSRTTLFECKHPIGRERYRDELLSKLDLDSNDVRFVAICGMGGLGKTTMAKFVYNHIRRKFNGSSFLEGVREEASKGNQGLVSLQNQLLKDTLNIDDNISIVSQGKKLIECRLKREKILLILDDVDHHEHLDALAGGINWFGEGSRIIITTRYDESLNGHRADKDIKIHKPEELGFENSLQLFSLHAFSMDEPLEKYKQLSHEIVKLAGGLPLTLEVLGSYLYRNDEEEWKYVLKGLKDISNNKVSGMEIQRYEEEVFDRLMISYKKLSPHAQTIFLDIACHFNGWKQEKAISIWKACGLRAIAFIKELTRKNLLKIVDDDLHWPVNTVKRLKMHDQLRYMGMRNVLKESAMNPTKLTRIWFPDEIANIFKKDTGTQMVEGIILDEHVKDRIFHGEEFVKMPNLRFLYLSQFDRIDDFSHLPSKLRWFCWHGCPSTILQANFCHEELVHLDLSQSKIKLAWNDIPQINNKVFQQLTVLILSSCWDLSVSPNFFSWFPCLRRLDLTSCVYLLELSDSICQMASLKSLILDNCKSFNKLPTSIGELTHLKTLSIRRTKIEELPDGVGQLENTKELNASNCHKLVRLPTSMGRMKSLLHLDLEDTMILELPNDFSNISSLEVLRMGTDVMAYNRRHLPLPLNNMTGFPSQLQELCLAGYINLESLSGLPSSLALLKVEYCISLPVISDLSQLKWLKNLILHECGKLERLPNLSKLKILLKLHICYCENLEEIHGLEETESLEELNVMYCPKLRKLPDLSNLKRLRILTLECCENLEEIHGLEGIEPLERLELVYCRKLRELPNLSNLRNLRKLDISYCENIEKIHGLEGTESLEVLEAWKCDKLPKLLNLSNLKNLWKLNLGDCEN
ncbi:disease resistance protein RPV1-like [Telopea speciosissima]|uniref:disease resistance protein RPV1-like n=1 Tax=Telopea speciosissima TaxID=54955 RepID=UPI001CC56411|nr:disease resistance protein RPV1-like [Telopea speciosissima]